MSNRMLRRGFMLAVLTLCACQSASNGAAHDARPRLNEPFQHLQLEWADTQSERDQGLMHRTMLAEDAGMMFVFEEPQNTCFWMKNTLIPLSIGFINAHGQLTQIEDMQPQSEQLHCPREPIRYALEVNQGWFERHGVYEKMSVLPSQ